MLVITYKIDFWHMLMRPAVCKIMDYSTFMWRTQTFPCHSFPFLKCPFVFFLSFLGNALGKRSKYKVSQMPIWSPLQDLKLTLFSQSVTHILGRRLLDSSAWHDVAKLLPKKVTPIYLPSSGVWEFPSPHILGNRVCQNF